MAARSKSNYSGVYLVTSGTWPDNSAGEISPADLRAGVQDLLDSNPMPWDTSYELNPSGGTKFGNVTNGNYTEFQNDTGFQFSYGSGLAWDDLRIPGNSVKTGASAPDLIAFVGGGLNGFGFNGDSILEQVFFQVQLPHAWKTGSTIRPHVHWTPTTTATGVVKWFFEYTWSDINITFSAPITLSGLSSITSDSQWKHLLTGFPEIDGSSISGVSSMLICRLYRDPTDGQDTYGADVGFLEFDIHYQIDTRGSRLPLSK